MNERVGTSNYDLAYIDYCNGMKYKDIAEKYGVTINTVKSWKTRYKWSKDNEKSVHTKIKNVCTQKNTKEKAAVKEVEQVMKNPELTDKQRLFCLYYTRSFNATKAYQKAYQCSYETAMVVSTMLNLLRIIFADSCENTIMEFGSYIWDAKAAEYGEDRPVKQHDHAMDAVRYFVFTILGNKPHLNRVKGGI